MNCCTPVLIFNPRIQGSFWFPISNSFLILFIVPERSSHSPSFFPVQVDLNRQNFSPDATQICLTANGFYFLLVPRTSVGISLRKSDVLSVRECGWENLIDSFRSLSRVPEKYLPQRYACDNMQNRKERKGAVRKRLKRVLRARARERKTKRKKRRKLRVITFPSFLFKTDFSAVLRVEGCFWVETSVK